MPALIVKLPRNRDFCGELRLIGERGAVLAGPFAIAGRAAQAPAEAAGNPTRSPSMRFGDTPTGRYKIRAILPSGAGTAYREAAYGGNGIIVLDPCGGDAALAEANGRFHVFIQGGARADGRLCATNGALRMRNEDLAILCALLGEADGVECWCVEDAAMPCREAVMFDHVYEEGDPPPLILQRPAGQDVSRRRMLAGGAAMASSVLLPGVFVAAASPSPALAQNAYDNNNSNNNGQQDNQDQNNQQQPNQDQNNNGQQQNQDQDNSQPPNQDNNDNNNQDNNNNNDDNSAPKAY